MLNETLVITTKAVHHLAIRKPWPMAMRSSAHDPIFGCSTLFEDIESPPDGLIVRDLKMEKDGAKKPGCFFTSKSPIPFFGIDGKIIEECNWRGIRLEALCKGLPAQIAFRLVQIDNPYFKGVKMFTSAINFLEQPDMPTFLKMVKAQREMDADNEA